MGLLPHKPITDAGDVCGGACRTRGGRHGKGRMTMEMETRNGAKGAAAGRCAGTHKPGARLQ